MEYHYDENKLYQVGKISLADTKEKIELWKRSFECKQKSSYGIEKRNDMIHIHDKEVNKISE